MQGRVVVEASVVVGDFEYQGCFRTSGGKRIGEPVDGCLTVVDGVGARSQRLVEIFERFLYVFGSDFQGGEGRKGAGCGQNGYGCASEHCQWNSFDRLGLSIMV